jgi:hypothetical protein
MPDFRILCEPDGKTGMALAAPQQTGDLVIADVAQSEDQLWQLEACAGVDVHDNAVLGFYLVNKKTMLVAQAPHKVDGAVAPDKQGVGQAPKGSHGIVSPIRQWTLVPVRDGFAIRPLGDVHQNLNAWDGKAVAGTSVGIYRWKDGQPNEIWGIQAVGG